MKLINIGFGNIVFANRLIAIVSPESAPVKRLIQDARDRGMLIDATYGRRTRAVLITDSDHVILSAVQPETVANRLNAHDGAQGPGAEEENRLFGSGDPKTDGAEILNGGDAETDYAHPTSRGKKNNVDAGAGTKKNSGAPKGGAAGRQKRRRL